MTPTERLVVLGAGEVGRIYARAAAAQYAVDVYDPLPRADAKSVLAEFGAELYATTGSWLDGVRRVWSCVPGDVALDAFTAMLPHLDEGAIFVDLTTASPEAKREASRRADESHIVYVDVAIMGAIALTASATPLLVAGRSSEVVAAEFRSVGAVITSVDNGEVGDAVRLKLLRTVITKGVEALAVDAFAYADRYGLRADLLGVLSDIDDQGLSAFLAAVVDTHERHSERRMHEVERAITQLRAAGLASSTLEGALARFQETVMSGRSR